MDPIRGTIEILTGIAPSIENQSMTVEAALPAIVPALVQAWKGLTNLEPADPTDDLQVAAWTTQDSKFRPVRVILWREPTFDETAIGQLLAGQGEGA